MGTVIRKAPKGAIPVHTSAKAPTDYAWDVDAAKKRVVAKLGVNGWLGACAWVDPNIDGVTAGKLGHHDIVGGQLKVVWRAIAQCRAILGGARGGVKIPASQMPATRSHIDHHYEQFRKLFSDDVDAILIGNLSKYL